MYVTLSLFGLLGATYAVYTASFSYHFLFCSFYISLSVLSFVCLIILTLCWFFSFIHSFIHYLHLFVYLFIYLFIYLFVYSFIYLFIYLFVSKLFVSCLVSWLVKWLDGLLVDSSLCLFICSPIYPFSLFRGNQGLNDRFTSHIATIQQRKNEHHRKVSVQLEQKTNVRYEKELAKERAIIVQKEDAMVYTARFKKKKNFLNLLNKLLFRIRISSNLSKWDFLA